MRNIAADVRELGRRRFLWHSLMTWTQFGIWPNFGLSQIFPPRKQETSDTEILPRWLRKEKVTEYRLEGARSESFKSDSDLDGSLRDFHALSRVADYAGLYSQVDQKHQVEASDPFSDARVLGFAAKLPGCPWRTHKFVMRSAMKNRLHRDVLMRPKSSAPSQLMHFLLDDQSSWVDRVVRDVGLRDWIDICELPPSRTWGYGEMTALTHSTTLFLALWMKRFTAPKDNAQPDDRRQNAIED